MSIGAQKACQRPPLPDASHGSLRVPTRAQTAPSLEGTVGSELAGAKEEKTCVYCGELFNTAATRCGHQRRCSLGPSTWLSNSTKLQASKLARRLSEAGSNRQQQGDLAADSPWRFPMTSESERSLEDLCRQGIVWFGQGKEMLQHLHPAEHLHSATSAECTAPKWANANQDGLTKTRVYLDSKLPSALHSFSANTQHNKKGRIGAGKTCDKKAWLEPSVRSLVKKKVHPKRMCLHCVCVCVCVCVCMCVCVCVCVRARAHL